MLSFLGYCLVRVCLNVGRRVGPRILMIQGRGDMPVRQGVGGMEGGQDTVMLDTLLTFTPY